MKQKHTCRASFLRGNIPVEVSVLPLTFFRSPILAHGSRQGWLCPYDPTCRWHRPHLCRPGWTLTWDSHVTCMPPLQGGLDHLQTLFQDFYSKIQREVLSQTWAIELKSHGVQAEAASWGSTVSNEEGVKSHRMWKRREWLQGLSEAEKRDRVAHEEKEYPAPALQFPGPVPSLGFTFYSWVPRSITVKPPLTSTA